MNDSQLRTLTALAQALFPAERPLELDATAAGMAGSVAPWLEALPMVQRAGVLAALSTFDAGFGLWCGRPGRSFADGTAAERRAWVEAVSEAPAWPARKAFDALHFLLVMHYAERPAVLAAIDPTLGRP